jgi:hypothetical protein
MSLFTDSLRPFRPRPDRLPSRWVLVGYDQLRPAHPLLADAPPSDTGVIYVETAAKPARRPYHAQKVTLLLAAMRHDALDIRWCITPPRSGTTVHSKKCGRSSVSMRRIR